MKTCIKITAGPGDKDFVQDIDVHAGGDIFMMRTHGAPATIRDFEAYGKEVCHDFKA